MDVKLDNFLNAMVSKGKITQEEADEKRAKHDKKEQTKADYKSRGKSMKKDELIALLEDLTE